MGLIHRCVRQSWKQQACATCSVGIGSMLSQIEPSVFPSPFVPPSNRRVRKRKYNISDSLKYNTIIQNIKKGTQWTIDWTSRAGNSNGRGGRNSRLIHLLARDANGRRREKEREREIGTNNARLTLPCWRGPVGGTRGGKKTRACFHVSGDWTRGEVEEVSRAKRTRNDIAAALTFKSKIEQNNVPAWNKRVHRWKYSAGGSF